MADLLDVITLQAAKDELRVTGSSNDLDLEVYITAISRGLDDLCGPIVQREVVETVTPPRRGGIVLTQWPVASVTEVVEWSGGVDTALTAENPASPSSYDYFLDGSVLYRRSGAWDASWAPGRGTVTVTYQAGRFPDTESVDGKFQLAARILVRHFWRYQQTTGSQVFARPPEDAMASFPSFFMPYAVEQLLADERRSKVMVG